MKIIEIHTNDANEAVLLANKQRLLNKNNWIEIHFIEFGAIVKNYGTWLQIMQKNGVHDSGPMEQTVKGWKSTLLAFLNQ